MAKNIKKKLCQICRGINITCTIITLLLAVFDLGADWWVFKDFCIYSPGTGATIALGIVCLVSTVLFALEIRNCVWTIQYLRRRKGSDAESDADADVKADADLDAEAIAHLKADSDADVGAAADVDAGADAVPDPDADAGADISAGTSTNVNDKIEGVELQKLRLLEMTKTLLWPGVPSKKKLARWDETLSFLLLVFEDFPVIVIMYVTFKTGNCELFKCIFEDSFTANLALIGAVLGDLWKVLQAVCYFCSCRFPDIHGCCGHLCCCCWRGLRPLFAIILLGFEAYLAFTFNFIGIAARPDCANVESTTVNMTHSP